MQHERKERTSIEQWHEARKSRTSIDICSAFNVTTTERLSVCKAGITILINRTYIVIKHLGSGSSGQVKLAFNLRSKKLVAIKAVRKAGSQLGGARADRDTRSYDGRGSLGSGSLGSGGHGHGGHHHHHHHHHGGHPGLAAGHSVNAISSGGGGGGSSKGWRSIAPSALLRRSASSNVTATWSGVPGSAPAAPPSALRGGAAVGPTSSAAGAAGSAPSTAPARPPPEELVREIAILKRLSHPNIVQLVEVIDDPASDCLLLVMGYVEGATLQPAQLAPGRWRPVPEQDSLTGVVRILDFGSAVLTGRMPGEEGLRGAHVPMSCTPGFRSPESLAAGYRPSFELDMWALGVCLYLWVYGELPFKGSAPFVVYENIRSASLALPGHTQISLQLTDLITRLLDKDPGSRLTVHEAVLHPWTTAQGLAPLRTCSPLVMATRIQHAAEQAAAATGLLPPAESLPSPPLPPPAAGAVAAGAVAAGQQGQAAAAAAAAVWQALLEEPGGGRGGP
ncbi:hypothetical protein GPECTOR_74g668 [Gonium pectorale]|uniref:Protein kinase domain-containing protein n=1 Tax=Gonium pectorale TaxID=33097 RepID=A0A150G2L2_GONPE|nr:hypothetical protein GPECTOR_74g668 [Gonium pectorale]|eukprot:KXZ44054.1 hypothetical protein GPECTOR_74g668 [Gonium pectorale]